MYRSRRVLCREEAAEWRCSALSIKGRVLAFMLRVLFVFFSCSLSVGVLSLVTEIMVMFCGGLRSGLLARITVEMATCQRERRRQGFVGPCAVSDTRSSGWGSKHH